MSRTPVRTALAQGQPAVGFWLTLPSAALARTVLSTGGFSWVLVDAEHGLITDRDYYELVNAIAAAGATPIIRVPRDEDWMVKRALDAGAHGVMTPMCNSAADARRVVAYSKYPPAGVRGYGPLFAPHAHAHGAGAARGAGADGYDARADAELLVAVQVETAEGVANVEEIAMVDGVDVLLIGPFDLSKFMNVVFGSDEHEQAIERIRAAAKAAGKTAAIFCTSGAQARARLAQGFDMVSVCTDGTALVGGFGRELAQLRGGEAPERAGGY